MMLQSCSDYDDNRQIPLIYKFMLLALKLIRRLSVINNVTVSVHAAGSQSHRIHVSSQTTAQDHRPILYSAPRVTTVRIAKASSNRKVH
jgi:hypothetical protein